MHAHFFLLELKTTDAPGKEDPLAIWDDFPPYSSPFGDTLNKARLETLIERLHARQYTYHKSYEIDRLAQFRASNNADDNLKDVDREINTNLLEWKILCSILKTFRDDSIDYAVGHLHMQWKARRVMALLEDWKALKKDGIDGFMVLYCNRW